VDWLIVDHYGLDATWESVLRACARRIMVIDDLADRLHDCDVLLDQNLLPNPTSRYRGKVPADCTLLLGTHYALLQPDYGDLRAVTAPRRRVQRILISWGGTDNRDLTTLSLAACRALSPTVRIDVVITHAYENAERVKRIAAADHRVQVHCDVPTLAPLMAAADLAVGAVGTSSWERLCLGLPAIAGSVADNQREIAEELSRKRLIEYVGHRDAITEHSLRRALARCMEMDLLEWSDRCFSALDGKGAERVARELVQPASGLRLRTVGPNDEDVLLEWANDSLTRRNAFNSAPISPSEHHAWFTGRLATPERCRMYIAEDKTGALVGQVRFDRGDAAWTISYTLAPAFRGRGLGRALLHAALRALRGAEPGAETVGLVKEFNRPSCRIFESLGFDACRIDGVMEYRRHA
jgi:UDP-2,4-diacetamido-2,4,6-trideoxy-beta-L-altropyranose hydrolase